MLKFVNINSLEMDFRILENEVNILISKALKALSYNKEKGSLYNNGESTFFKQEAEKLVNNFSLKKYRLRRGQKEIYKKKKKILLENIKSELDFDVMFMIEISKC
jgi:hypothetical protein